MTISLVMWILVVGVAVPLLVLVGRWFDRRRWRHTVIAYEVRFPKGLTVAAVSAWLAHLAAITCPSRRGLLPTRPVGVEITSTSTGVRFYVVAARKTGPSLLAGVQAALPGARITEAPNYTTPPTRSPRWRVAGEVTVTSRERPLATDRAEHAATALLAALHPAPVGGQVRIQWLITDAGSPPPVPSVTSRSRPTRWWRRERPFPDREAARAARVKYRDPLLFAVARIAVAASSPAAARAVWGRVWPALRLLDAPGVRIRRRALPTRLVVSRLIRRVYPLTRWPLLISTTEAAGLLPLPVGDAVLPGVAVGAARQLPPPPAMPSARGVMVGVSNYPGLVGRPITLADGDRLLHQFVLGPTGSGKSWLLARMILHDITAHRGVIVIDPSGDLITDMLARVPDAHAGRVVVVDAGHHDRPAGLNILGGARSQADRERVVDTVLHVFKTIWAGSWGPRSDAVCRNALATLVGAHGADGAALTLCELPALLTEPAFRRMVLAQSSVPEVVRPFWRRYEAMSEAERQQVIAPLVNKVEAFTTRTPIRLLLGQSEGIDLRDVFTHRKVVLVSLAKGVLGAETANLLGSLLVSLLWQTTLQRITVPAARRHACFAYIDEAADLLRLPVPLADMFAQARSLGLGLVLASQVLAQVPDAVRGVFLGTVRTQMTFAVEHDDATLLARRFAPLTAPELSGLAAYEAALRPCVGGVTGSPVTLTTLPLDTPVRDPAVLAEASRTRWGRPRAEVEAALRARTVTASTAVGRHPRGAPT